MESAAGPGDRAEERSGFLAWLEEFWWEVAVRAAAHELSSEWRRRRGIALGFTATLVSLAVGTAVFAAAANEVELSALEAPWKPLYYLVIVLALLAPVLASLQAHVRDPERAEAHKRASSGYFRLRQKAELWRIDAAADELPTRDQRAYLAQEREELFKASVTPGRYALRLAERRLRSERRERLRPSEHTLARAGEQLLAALLQAGKRLWAAAVRLRAPGLYLAAALYLGRSPQPLLDRLGVLAVLGGALLLWLTASRPGLFRPKRPHWIYRCLPSVVGLGVLLILLGNVLLFPSRELVICCLLWAVLDLAWRKPAPEAPARGSVPKLPAEVWAGPLAASSAQQR